MRLHKICVVTALAFGISPAAALAGTHSGPAHKKKSRHRAHPVRSATDPGPGGASAGGSSAQSFNQAPSQPSGSGTAPAPQPSPGAPQGDPNSGSVNSSGGQAYGQPNPATAATVPGVVGKILSNGLAAAPADAPPAVQQAIWAANNIIGDPYVYGGGHGAFKASGYDCSGTVSYALHGGNLLASPLDSSSFMSWGERGTGQWITVWTNPGHAFLVIAGLRLDTSAAGDPHGGSGPRWRPVLRSKRGFHARHPLSY